MLRSLFFVAGRLGNATKFAGQLCKQLLREVSAMAPAAGGPPAHALMADYLAKERRLGAPAPTAAAAAAAAAGGAVAGAAGAAPEVKESKDAQPAGR